MLEKKGESGCELSLGLLAHAVLGLEQLPCLSASPEESSKSVGRGRQELRRHVPTCHASSGVHVVHANPGIVSRPPTRTLWTKASMT